ncbi:Two-component hybrid sensor and regulator [uncultured Pleomorphomonas sp.]|uniref:DNA-binding response regulator n=2 Tax=Pleomorphomonas TaxID=261933 RepID=A0A2G9WP38_9HYPH|nr:response regulator [Pleomorphomonas carboxyditropha]PIO96478.1 DNA-binding response regulator [Pleomorphomonas carboxyditropha]SCM77998.1 Two-component hybrid sensor and regulator [uncultured Pleomorphomonas sp.]
MTPTRDTVLVVDDSPETLGFLTEAMEAEGVTVLVATSGRQALAIAGRVTPDVVLMDAVMPEMDGFDACRSLKAMPALAHVPVIFMTGLSETEHVVRGLASGGVDYLTKPIDLDELRARIRVHLANARASLSAQAALDAAGRHLIALDPDGRIVWATPQASRLIDELGIAKAIEAAAASSDGQLELAIPDALPLLLAPVGAAGPGERLYRLARSEADEANLLRSRFSLTAREAEVLLWIGRGKTNRDIGDILGLSPRTVNKHLEQIYAKLGVENRASAALKAADALRDG